MRGVVTLAVPLTLPIDMPGRDLMLICAFAVIVVTVVGQGSSLGWVIRHVWPIDEDPPAKIAMPGAEVAMARARLAILEHRAQATEGAAFHPILLQQYQQRMVFMEDYAADAGNAMETIRPQLDIMLHAIAAGRNELLRMHRAGFIEDEVLHELERDLDVEELGIMLQRGE
jgi:CPA1 family monovalent cation:H+ antiporter